MYIGARWGSAVGVNRFHYGLDNPVSYVDPDGEWANFIIGGIVGAAEDLAFQSVMMLAGAQEEFSWTSLAVSTGVGAVTSGYSAAAQSGRVGMAVKKLAGKLGRKGDDVAKRPSSFRKKTLKDSWDNAADGSKTGAKQCPDCKKDVFGNPHKNEKRNGSDGWDNDHQPKWNDRDLSGMDRKQVLDEYNKDTRLRCPSCNRADNQ